MLDPKWIREHSEEVAVMLKNRNNTEFPLDKFMELERRRREILLEAETYKEKRNAGAKQVGILKKAGENADALMEEMRLIGDKVKVFDDEAAEIENELNDLAMRVPNKPHESVPIGKDENDNVEQRRWGTPKTFDFEPKAHWDIAEPLDIMDFERGVKLAESRFTVLKAEGARLERGLMNFMLDLHTTQHGFTEVAPPILVNTNSMSGTGQLPKFAELVLSCLVVHSCPLFRRSRPWALVGLSVCPSPNVLMPGLSRLSYAVQADTPERPLQYSAPTASP